MQQAATDGLFHVVPDPNNKLAVEVHRLARRVQDLWDDAIAMWDNTNGKGLPTRERLPPAMLDALDNLWPKVVVMARKKTPGVKFPTSWDYVAENEDEDVRSLGGWVETWRQHDTALQQLQAVACDVRCVEAMTEDTKPRCGDAVSLASISGGRGMGGCGLWGWQLGLQWGWHLYSWVGLAEGGGVLARSELPLLASTAGF